MHHISKKKKNKFRKRNNTHKSDGSFDIEFYKPYNFQQKKSLSQFSKRLMMWWQVWVISSFWNSRKKSYKINLQISRVAITVDFFSILLNSHVLNIHINWFYNSVDLVNIENRYVFYWMLYINVRIPYVFCSTNQKYNIFDQDVEAVHETKKLKINIFFEISSMEPQ